MASDDIESLITKDGTKYTFDQPAALVKNNLIGVSNGKQIAIPRDNVASVYVKKPNEAGTILLIVGIAAEAALIYVAVVVGHVLRTTEDALSGH
jgi:hypothetical protein